MKAPRYVEVPLYNGDTARVGAWPCSTPGLLVTESNWFGYDITHEESLTRVCGPFQQRAEAVTAARKLGETGVMWDISREDILAEPDLAALLKAAIQEVMESAWTSTN